MASIWVLELSIGSSGVDSPKDRLSGIGHQPVIKYTAGNNRYFETLTDSGFKKRETMICTIPVCSLSFLLRLCAARSSQEEVVIAVVGDGHEEIALKRSQIGISGCKIS